MAQRYKILRESTDIYLEKGTVDWDMCICCENFCKLFFKCFIAILTLSFIPLSYGKETRDNDFYSILSLPCHEQ